MPPPVNIDIAHAIEVFPLPSVNTQQVDFGGTTYTVYYKMTVNVEGEIGVFAFGDLSVYKPTLEVLESDGITDYISGFNALNVPIQAPFPVGIYYLKIIPNAGNPTPANLTLSAQYGPNDTAEIGDLFINDDEIGFPGVFVNHSTGAVRRFIQPFVSGEAGDRLPDGTMLFEDINDTSHLKLYDKDFNFLSSVSYWGIGIPRIRAANIPNKFYAESLGAGARAIDANGNIVASYGLSGAFGLAANNDESIIYYTLGSFNSPVKRWLTASNAGTTDLVAGIVGFQTLELLVLRDGSIVVVYFKGTEVKSIVYDSTGAIISTADFPGSYLATPPRLFYTNDDPTTYGLWLHPDNGVGLIKVITTTTGAVVSTIPTQDYEGGTYQAASTTSPVRFGTSQSCPIIELPFAGTTSTTGVIVVTKTGTPLGDTTQFQFSISGGLSPATFVLIGGQTQIFNDVPVGTYIIAEIAGNFHTVIDVNGVTYDTTSVAVTVSTTGTIAVTVTNTFFGEFSGIYYIHPDKTNDTVFTSIVSPTVFTTAVVKIPNPFVLL